METIGFRIGFRLFGTMYALADTGQEKTKVVSRLTWFSIGTMRAVCGLARPRQIAMALAKESTQHSLPEIGEAFGGKDHTTVVHRGIQIGSLRATPALATLPGAPYAASSASKAAIVKGKYQESSYLQFPALYMDVGCNAAVPGDSRVFHAGCG